MRRTLVGAAVAVILILLTASILPFNFDVVLCVFLFAILVLCLAVPVIRKKKEVSVIAFFAFAACLYFILTTVLQIWPVAPMIDREATVSGVLAADPEPGEDNFSYILETESIALSGAPQKLKLKLYGAGGMKAEAYDKMTANVMFYEPSGVQKNQLYSDGIYLCGYVTLGTAQITKADSKPLSNIFIQIQRYVNETVHSFLSYDEAAALSGLTLGDTSGMSESAKDNIRNSGISHIMAVSGMHLAIICQLLMSLLKRLKVGRRPLAIITIFAVIFIMGVTGFCASILRAGITYLIMLAGMLFFRKVDSVTSLSAAMLILLAVNPYSVNDISLQLSCGATLGIILLSPYFEKRLAGLIKKKSILQTSFRAVSLISSQTLSAIIFTLPVSILVFGQMSLIAPITNIAVSSASNAALICSVFGCVFANFPLFSFISYPLFFIGGILMKYISMAADFFGSLSFATAPMAYTHISLWIACTLILLAVALLLQSKNRRVLRLTALLSVVMLLISSFSYSVFNNGVTQICTLDVKTGIAVMLYRQGHCVLIGAGGDQSVVYKARNFLQARGASLDMVILPELEAAYSGGAVSLLQSVDADLLLSPQYGTYYDAVSSLADNALTHKPLENAIVELWGDVIINSLYTDTGVSIALSINQTRVLIPSPGQDFDGLPEEYRSCQLMVSTANTPVNVPANLAYGFVSGYDVNGIAAAGRLSSAGVTSYFTGSRGNLLASTRGHGDIMVRREKS